MNKLIAFIRVAFQYPDIRKNFFVTTLFVLSTFVAWYSFWYVIHAQDYVLQKLHLKNLTDDIGASHEKKIAAQHLILRNDVLYDQIRRQSVGCADTLSQQLSQLLEILPAKNAEFLHCEPGKIIHKDLYDKIPIEIEMHISYVHFKKFIELIGSKKIFYRFVNLVIEPLEEIVQVRMLCMLYSIAQEAT
jgi:hypothetical protein